MRWMFLLFAVGCVAKGRHELIEVQLAATRVALADQEADQTADLRAAQDEIVALTKEIDARQVQLDALTARIERLDVALEDAARSEAAHVAADQLACEPAPPAAGRPEPIPARRAHLDATVEEMARAVATLREQAVSAGARAAGQAAAQQAFAALVQDGLAELVPTDDGTVVRVLVVKLFNENRVTLSPLGETVVQRLAEALSALPDQNVRLVGHTDDRAIYSVEHPSNWERGFAYAVGVLRGLEEHGIPQRPVVASMAGLRPAVEGTSAEDRRLNTRVELRLSLDPGVLERFPASPPAEEPTPPPEPPEQGALPVEPP